ncbi:LysE family translocator [Marinobacterium arenosum]|uniref:LysE family translocator n=1 Tax=Marinobacterium arenosum TaxID=2862496 RepID=UPI001C95AA1D|nr:LysE family translocator [Marinobacterium arenosum]MBY4678403.1 LysE family translocator [Marinobacterium arenosum]
MSLDTWLLFTSATFFVILIPGPLSLLMVANTLNYGLVRSAPAFLGGVSASLLLLSLSATGLAAFITASEQLFTTLKIGGALYLIYLGYRSWKEPTGDAQLKASQNARFGTLFWRAFTLAASNPKDILFFLAFLPQFINPEALLMPQLLVMIATWAVADLLCKLFYGGFAKLAAPALTAAHRRRAFNRVTAAIFVGAGTFAALSR